MPIINMKRIFQAVVLCSVWAPDSVYHNPSNPQTASSLEPDVIFCMPVKRVDRSERYVQTSQPHGLVLHIRKPDVAIPVVLPPQILDISTPSGFGAKHATGRIVTN